MDLSLNGLLSSLPYMMILLFGVLLWAFIMRWKYAKESEHCVWGEFFAKSGYSYGMLCKEERGQVEAPKGHEIGVYFVDNDCAYDFMYPPGKMKFLQVRVRRSVWMENNPVPKVSTNPEKWIENEKQVEITAFMIQTAANESFQKSALEMQKTFWSEITNIAKFVKNVPYSLYASVGACILAGVACYFAYMCYGFMVARFP
jgi:hypothetical protein